VNTLIARSSQAPQPVFPAVGPDLYRMEDEGDVLTPDQQVARMILSLANRDFSPIQRLAGWGLDGVGRVARLLHLHKLGMEAELAGKWQRADHFWGFVRDEMRDLADRMDLWQEVVQALANRLRLFVLNDPVQLRQRLVHEVFVDVHCAFYNGYLQAADSLKWKSRAFVHLDCIRGLLAFAPVSRENLQTVLAPAMETWIRLCEEAQQWDRAQELCSDLLGYLPDVEEYQDWLARLHLASTLARVKKAKSPKASLKNAKSLQESIGRMEQMRQDYPYSLAVFEALGHLHHQRAINLANGRHLSEAILSAQKAVAYNPMLEQAQETRDALVQTMQRLQAQMQQVQANLARRPRSRLTEEGAHLLKEASRGFSPAVEFLKSGEVEVTQAFYAVQGRRLWRDIGLAEPPDRWDERSRALLVGLSQVLRQPPDHRQGVAAAWKQVAAENQDLADLDAVPICAYLTRRLFEDGPAPIQEPPAPARATPQKPPAMTRVSRQRRRGGEPFAFWLFSNQDKRIKVQAVVAVILVLLVGWLVVRDLSVRAARDTAYAQIVEAAGNQDPLGIIEGAEIYFTNKPLSGRDRRDEQVQALYTEAFVRWFVGLEGEPDADAQTRIERYQALILDRDRQGGDRP
jgi:hypothetical protein